MKTNKKICPKMSRPVALNSGDSVFHEVFCYEEDCMAWGMINVPVKGLPIDEGRKEYCCKLIERS